MPDFIVDGRHQFHVGLAPLPTQVLGLHLQQLQRVQLHQNVAHPERPFEHRGRLEHHEHHGSRVLPFGQFVQRSQQIDGGENVAPKHVLLLPNRRNRFRCLLIGVLII